MAAIQNLAAEIGASYAGSSSGATGVPAITFLSQASAGAAVRFDKTVLSTPTSALVEFGTVSTASAPVFQLLGQSFVSAVSIVFAAGTGWAGMGGVRVLLPDGQTYGWIPILPSAVVTAAAR